MPAVEANESTATMISCIRCHGPGYQTEEELPGLSRKEYKLLVNCNLHLCSSL